MPKLTKAAQEKHLWSEFIQTIRRMNRMHPDFDNYEELVAQKANFDMAAEQITALIRLKTGPPSLVTSVPTPTGSAGTPSSQAGVKRKRRLSISASPAPPTSGIMESLAPSVPSPAVRGSTPMSRELTGKGKNKEPYADQLPLRPQRRVGFRVKDKQQGMTEADWIMTTVTKSLNGDPRKYEVVDVDEHGVVEATYTTTLRSLLLLPDKAAPLTNSANPRNVEDYQPGTTVLAMYPETTSLYRAEVISAPKPPAGAKYPYAASGVYKLTFMDDGGRVQEVDKENVILHPDFQS